jgi:hypothetical protein
VTKKVIAGQPSMAAYTCGAAAVRCSKVSSTISDGLPASRSASSARRSPPVSLTPIALATSGTISAASLTSPRLTK